MHLGEFLTEQLAAKAHDRAAISKSRHETQPPPTNYDMSSYLEETDILKALNPKELVTALADEEYGLYLDHMLSDQCLSVCSL